MHQQAFLGVAQGHAVDFGGDGDFDGHVGVGGLVDVDVADAFVMLDDGDGGKHVPRYLAEFEYQFNRRYDLGTMIPRLAFVALRTAPMPYRLLKLADVAA